MLKKIIFTTVMLALTTVTSAATKADCWNINRKELDSGGNAQNSYAKRMKCEESATDAPDYHPFIAMFGKRLDGGGQYVISLHGGKIMPGTPYAVNCNAKGAYPLVVQSQYPGGRFPVRSATGCWFHLNGMVAMELHFVDGGDIAMKNFNSSLFQTGDKFKGWSQYQ